MKQTGERRSFLWPFHKDSASKFGLHITVGFVIAVLPVFQILVAHFSLTNRTPYCALWTCGN